MEESIYLNKLLALFLLDDKIRKCLFSKKNQSTNIVHGGNRRILFHQKNTLHPGKIKSSGVDRS